MKTATQLSLLLQKLHADRKANKKTNPRTARLTALQRAKILEKTESRCHICGCDLKPDNFQADHVKNHASAGVSKLDNFLASCNTCNNYRWHYLPEEIQWILKLGVFAKTLIEMETPNWYGISRSICKKGTKKSQGCRSQKVTYRVKQYCRIVANQQVVLCCLARFFFCFFSHRNILSSL